MKTGQISKILPAGQKLLFSNNLFQITAFPVTTFKHKIPPNNLSGIITLLLSQVTHKYGNILKSAFNKKMLLPIPSVF